MKLSEFFLCFEADDVSSPDGLYVISLRQSTNTRTLIRKARVLPAKYRKPGRAITIRKDHEHGELIKLWVMDDEAVLRDPDDTNLAIHGNLINNVDTRHYISNRDDELNWWERSSDLYRLQGIASALFDLESEPVINVDFSGPSRWLCLEFMKHIEIDAKNYEFLNGLGSIKKANQPQIKRLLNDVRHILEPRRYKDKFRYTENSSLTMTFMIEEAILTFLPPTSRRAYYHAPTHIWEIIAIYIQKHPELTDFNRLLCANFRSLFPRDFVYRRAYLENALYRCGAKY